MASELEKIRSRRRALERKVFGHEIVSGGSRGGVRDGPRMTAATGVRMTEGASRLDSSPTRTSIERRRARVPLSAGGSSSRLRAARRMNQPYDEDEDTAAPPPTPNRRPSPQMSVLARKKPWLDDQSIASSAVQSSADDVLVTPRQLRSANRSSPRTSPESSNSSNSGGSPRESSKERRRKSRPWRVDVLLKKGGGRAVEHSTTSWKQQMRERKEVFALSGVTVVEQELDYCENEPQPFPDLDEEGGDHHDPPRGRKHADFYNDEVSRGPLDDHHDDSISMGATIQLANPLSSNSLASSDGSSECPKTINIEKYTRPQSPTNSAEVVINYDKHAADEINDRASSSVAIHDTAYDPNGNEQEEEEDNLTNIAVNSLNLVRQETGASSNTTPSERRAIDTFRSLTPARPNDLTSPPHPATSESGTAESEEAPVIRDAMEKPTAESQEPAQAIAAAEAEPQGPTVSVATNETGHEKASSDPNAVAEASKVADVTPDGSVSGSIVQDTMEDDNSRQEEEVEEDELKATKSKVIQEMESSVPLSLKEEARYSLVSVGRASRVVGEKKVREEGYAEALLRKSLFLKELGVAVSDLYTSHYDVVESASGFQENDDDRGTIDESSDKQADRTISEKELAEGSLQKEEPKAALQVSDSLIAVPMKELLPQEALSTQVAEAACPDNDTKDTEDSDAMRQPSSGLQSDISRNHQGEASKMEAVLESTLQSSDPVDLAIAIESANDDLAGNAGESPLNGTTGDKKSKGKANKWKQRLAKKKGGDGPKTEDDGKHEDSTAKTTKEVSTTDASTGAGASPVINAEALDNNANDVNEGRRISTKGQKWMKRLATKRESKVDEDSPKPQTLPLMSSPTTNEHSEPQNFEEGIANISSAPKLNTISAANTGPASLPIAELQKVPESAPLAVQPSSVHSNPDNSNQKDQAAEKSTPAPKANLCQGESPGKIDSTTIESSSDSIKVSAESQAPLSKAIDQSSNPLTPSTKASPRDLRNSFMAFDALLQQRQGFTLDSNTIDDDYTEYTIEDTITNGEDPKGSALPKQQGQTEEYDETETQYDEYSIEQSYMEYTVEETVQESEFGSGLEPLQQVNNTPRRSASAGYNTGLMSSRMFTSPQVVSEPTITVNQVEDDEMTQLTFDHSETEPIPETPRPPPVTQIEKPLKSPEKRGTPTTSAGSSTSSRKGTSVAGSQRSASSRSSNGSEGNSKRISELLRTDIWSEDYNVVQDALGFLWLEASRGTRQRAKINKFGGVMGIVRAMEKHREIDAIQVAACGALEKMALDPDTQVVIGEMGGISAIVQAMKSRPVHEVIQQAGSAALANISRHRGSKDEGEGAIPALCGCMSRFPTNMIIQAKAFAAIANLCMDNIIRLKELSDCGGMLAMTLALQKPWPSKTEKHAAISNLSILLRCLAEQEEGSQADDESGYFDQEDGNDSIDVMSLMSELDDAMSQLEMSQLEEEDYPYEIQDGQGDLSMTDEYQQNHGPIVSLSTFDAEGISPPSQRIEISNPGFENLGDALQFGNQEIDFGDALQSGVGAAEASGDGLQPSPGDVDVTGEPGSPAKQPSAKGWWRW